MTGKQEVMPGQKSHYGRLEVQRTLAQEGASIPRGWLKVAGIITEKSPQFMMFAARIPGTIFPIADCTPGMQSRANPFGAWGVSRWPLSATVSLAALTVEISPLHSLTAHRLWFWARARNRRWCVAQPRVIDWASRSSLGRGVRSSNHDRSRWSKRCMGRTEILTWKNDCERAWVGWAQVFK